MIKKALLTILIATSLQLILFAQAKNEYLANIAPWVQEQIKLKNPSSISEASKSTAINSRLRGQRGWFWDSGNLYNGDSITYSYSGGRGSDGNDWYLYDNSIHFVDEGNSMWYNKAHSSKTYDNANRILSDTSFSTPNSSTAQTPQRLLTYQYDAQGNNTEYITYYWINGGWVPSERFISTYNTTNNLLTYQKDTYNNGALSPAEKTTYTYYINDLVATKTYELYSNGGWENSQRVNNSYDLNNNLTSVIEEQWINGAWNNIRRTTHTFNSNGDYTITLIENFDTNTANWESTDRYTFTYNNLGYLTLQVSEKYYSFTSMWENDLKDEFTYDANGNYTETINSYWYNSHWQKDERNTFTYDLNENLLENFRYEWFGNWSERIKWYYRYNSYNQITLDSVLRYNSVVGDSYINYYYETYEEGTGITTIPTVLSIVSPNPFTQNVAIDLTVTEAGKHTFEVYNMAGQRIHIDSRHLAPGSQTIIWDGQEAPKGVYFYKVYSQSGLASGKLVKQ